MQQRLAILFSAGCLAFSVACSQSDAGITTAVKTKMAADDTVKAYKIDVDTHDHVVTLNGTVPSQAEKERAVAIARDTKGVANVVDDIAVGPTARATTGEVADRAEDKAGEAKDKSEQAARDAKDKTEDYARDAKEKTEDYAHDAKVKSENAADKTGEVITDAAITSEVKTKFLAEPGVSGLRIDVDTKDGVVTLNGNVKTQAEANKAMTIARNSKGVKRVVNNLKVG